MRERRTVEMIGGIAAPILLYGLLAMIYPKLMGIVSGGRLLEPEAGMWLLTAGNFFMLPVFWRIYRQDRGMRELKRMRVNGADGQLYKARERKTDHRFEIREMLLAVLGAVCISRGMNYVLALTPLPYWFPGYETASQEMYRCSLLSQIAAGCISAPLLEEMLMRGVLYGRLREFIKSPRTAMLVNGLLFGLFHGNVVQGMYAFVMGIFFALLYEVYDSLILPVTAHAAANGISLLAGQFSGSGGLWKLPGLYELVTAGFLLAGMGCFCCFRRKMYRRQEPLAR